MSDELDELKESAERAKENRALAPVSFTMAILAVFVASITLLGHRAHTEEILLQTRATDQWAYYQAKNMRLNNITALNELLGAEENTNAERVAEVRKHFKEEMEKYNEQKYDNPPEAYGAFAYAAMNLILDTIENVGPDRKKVVAALGNVKDRDSIVGKISFDDHGQNTVAVITKYVVQDGKFVEWQDSEYASGKRKLPGQK